MSWVSNDIIFTAGRLFFECQRVSYVLFEISELYLVFSECTLISCCQELNLPIYGNVNVVATFLCGLDMPLSGEEVPPSLTWSVRFFRKDRFQVRTIHTWCHYTQRTVSQKITRVFLHVFYVKHFETNLKICMEVTGKRTHFVDTTKPFKLLKDDHSRYTRIFYRYLQ